MSIRVKDTEGNMQQGKAIRGGRSCFSTQFSGRESTAEGNKQTNKKVNMLVAQPCRTLCDSMGSIAHQAPLSTGFLARILE